MFRMSNTLIVSMILALIALLAPMAQMDARAAQAVQAIAVTPTPGPPPPIVVGRITTGETSVVGLPAIGPLTFASELNEQGLPAVPGSEFLAGTQAIYVFFNYNGFARGGQFEQIWYIDGNEMGHDQWAWDEAENGLYRGGLNIPGGLLPGSYQLDIVMDGQLLSSGKFVVTLAPTPAGPAIGSIIFAEGVENGQPMNPGVKFPADTKAIYAIFDFTGIRMEAELTATLFMGDKRLMSQASLWELGESGKAASVNLSNDRGYKVGQYRLVLSVDGVELQSGAFEISSEPVSTEITTPIPLVIATTAPTPVVVIATAEPTPMPTATTAPTPMPTATTVPAPPSPTPQPVAITAKPFKIVYTRVDNNIPTIWVMNLDGSDQHKVADYGSDPTWSPDGSRIVFFGYDGAKGGRGIYQMKADGTEASVIWNEGTAEYLDWAPSGPYVAMTALNSIIVYDGKAGKWQTISKGEQPSFAPTSEQIVAKSCDGGSCGLFTMNRDGSNRYRITTSAEDAMPAWSPTFKRIAYANQTDGNWDIYTANVDGSDQVRLTDDPGIDAMPAWLPDGSGIVFRSTRGGVWGIWIMNADGTDQQKIIDAPAADNWGRTRLDVR